MAVRSGTVPSNPRVVTSERDSYVARIGCVLVVDDDPEVRDVTEAILTKAGYLVVTAENGDEGLTLVRSARPALIFLDLNMPVMGGAEFRQAQRRDPELIRIPTVVMTAAADEPLLDLAIEETLRKPVHMDDLMRIVRRHCVSSRR
jgi:CheY-like chemotaxis protein